MSKSKSIFVTALVALMLAAILVGLYLLQMRVYMIFMGLLGLYGFLCGAFNFCQWLGKEQSPLPLPPQIKERPSRETWQPDDEYTANYDEIMAEYHDEEPVQTGL